MGDEIKKLRKARNTTQKELADFLGYSIAHISYIESGERKISTSDLNKIASFFDISVDYLLPKSKNFTNFRQSCESGEDIDHNKMMSDFKKFAKNKIHGDKKES